MTDGPAVTWMPDELVSGSTPHFRWREYAVSYSNPELVEPVPEHLRANVIRHAEQVAEPLRTSIRRPILTLSGYRSSALNAAVGGSPTSQHLEAAALDIAMEGIQDVFFALVKGAWLIGCGQVIYYPTGGRAKVGPFLHTAIPSVKYPRPSFHVHRPELGIVYRRVETVDEAKRLVALPAPRPARSSNPQ